MALKKNSKKIRARCARGQISGFDVIAAAIIFVLVFLTGCSKYNKIMYYKPGTCIEKKINYNNIVTPENWKTENDSFNGAIVQKIVEIGINNYLYDYIVYENGKPLSGIKHRSAGPLNLMKINSNIINCPKELDK